MTEASDATAGRVAAFFDVDHTLIEVNSGRKWVEHLWKHGQLSIPDALKSIWWLAQYKLSVIDYDDVTEQVLKAYAGRKVAELETEIRGWFESDIKPWVCAQAYEKVAWHKSQGHVLVMLTSGTEFSTQPLVELLGFDHLLCTRLVEEDGMLTGAFVRPACYGADKVTYAEALAEAEGIDMDASYAYADSFSDRAMLERVAEARVVNPDPRMRRHAATMGWSVETWTAASTENGDS